MKKICFIISGFAYSGAEIVLERYLYKNDIIDPYFIILYDNKDVINKFTAKYGYDKVTALNLNHSKARLHIMPKYDIVCIYNKLKIILNNINPDIIYANNTMELWLISKYVKRTNIKTVCHIHDTKKSIKNPLRKLWIYKSIKLYDEIIAVSEATKKSWNMNNCHVIYNGINDEKFIGDKFLTEKINTIGFIGSISKRKGVDLIINEIESMISMNYKIKIAYSNIEDIKLMDKLEYYNHVYQDNIFLYKNLNEDEVIKFYDSLDLLIVPSRHDPLPTVVIESMSRKTLVIGSNIDGIPEMIKNNKLLFKSNSSEEIKNKVIELSNYTALDRNKLVLEQYNYCKDKFNNLNKLNKINKILS